MKHLVLVDGFKESPGPKLWIVMAPPKPLVPGCARRGGVRQTAEGVLPSRGLGENPVFNGNFPSGIEV